jgi:hypothetical protein
MEHYVPGRAPAFAGVDDEGDGADGDASNGEHGEVCGLV